MKTFTGIVGATFILGSVVLLAIALVLYTLTGAPWDFVAVIGVVAFIIGIAFDYSADRQTCPDCAETIKVKAKVCHYCGHKFI